MPKIILLDDSTIAKIAAGEVIECPASVVKELVENSLDAGASEIIVKAKDGGKKQISVFDNGDGIEREDILLCFKKHATSKIKKIEDIFTVLSYGFRGEALATVAAVSKMEIISGTTNSELSYKLILDAGKQKEFLPEQKYKGTIINVYNLFYTIPARQKFLKSDAYEFRKIAEWIKAIAVPNYNIAFKLYNNDKLIFDFAKTDSVENRIKEVYRLNVLHGDYKDPIVAAKVFFTNPTDVMETFAETKQLFYINNRPIHNKTISFAITKAFESKVPRGKKPNVFIFLTLNPRIIDINVHPQKLEVRVKDNNTFFYPVYNSLKKALEAAPQPTATEMQRTKIISLLGNTLAKDNISDVVQKEMQSNVEGPPISHSKLDSSFTLTAAPQNKTENYKIIGQYDNTFIVIEDAKRSLLLIDQHVAEERYNFEKFLKMFNKEHTISGQELIAPMSVDCDAADLDILSGKKELFFKFGFDIDVLKDCFLVRRIPVVLGRIPDRVELKEMIVEILTNAESKEILDAANPVDKLHTSILITLACKSSIKADTPLGFHEMKRIVDNLFATENPYTCPHGRPIIIELTKKEIYRKIGRI